MDAGVFCVSVLIIKRRVWWSFMTHNAYAEEKLTSKASVRYTYHRRGNRLEKLGHDYCRKPSDSGLLPRLGTPSGSHEDSLGQRQRSPKQASQTLLQKLLAHDGVVVRWKPLWATSSTTSPACNTASNQPCSFQIPWRFAGNVPGRLDDSKR